MPRKGENIFKRKDGLWEARYVKEIDAFGKKKYGSVYAHSYTQVKEKRLDVLSNIHLREPIQSVRRMTVRQLTEEWLSVNQNRLKPSTYQKYCSLYRNHIQTDLGAIPAIYINLRTLQEFSSKMLNEGLSAKTINSVLVFIHTCLKYGYRQYNLPLIEMIYLKEDCKEMRVLSVTEQQKLVQYLNADLDIYKLGVLTALYTGLRIGELCALKWNDIEDGCIKVSKTMQRLSLSGGGSDVHIGPPKTKDSLRTIPIPSFLTETIEHFRPQNNDKYFLSKGYKQMAEPRLMQYKLKKYLSDCSIEGATFHTLRHTFATRCVECGFEMKTLSQILGHSKIAISYDLYIHSSFEMKKQNMDKLRIYA